LYLNSFNHFRVIAILFIITGHSFNLVRIEFNNLFNDTIRNILSGGSNLFIFISGYLFHHVFYIKFQYNHFLAKKLKNLLIPYLILGFIPIMFFVFLKQDAFNGLFTPTNTGIFYEYIIPTIKYYITGRFLTAYWYIPCLLVIFTMAPLHVKYINSPTRNQLLIILITSMLAVLGHRSVDSINIIQNVIYLTPLYLIGITASINSSLIYKNLTGGKEYILLLITITLAIFQAYLGFSGGYRKDFFEIGIIDLMFFQKIFLSFFFMVWLVRFESVNNRFIHVIAATSFTAFFIHPFIIRILMNLDLTFLKMNSWLFLIMVVLVILSICILVAKTIKKIIPKYSRFIIGY
jgi:hypothetical protein